MHLLSPSHAQHCHLLGLMTATYAQRHGPAAGLAAGPTSAMAEKGPSLYPAPKPKFAATAPLIHNAAAWLLQKSAQDTCLAAKARRPSVCVC